MTNQPDDVDESRPGQPAGDGHNLSARLSASYVWADERGIHIAFWDVPEDTENWTPKGLAGARYIMSLDVHGADQIAFRLSEQVHRLLDLGAPWQGAAQPPKPFALNKTGTGVTPVPDIFVQGLSDLDL